MADLSKLDREQAIALRDALDIVGTAAESSLSRIVFHAYIQADKTALDFMIASNGSRQSWKAQTVPKPTELWGR